MTTFADLTETVPDSLRPPLDRANVDLSALDPDQRHWRENGYLILRDFIPHALIDSYCAVRERDGEWATPVPYMDVPQIKDLCLYRPLMEKLKSLIGEELAMHLNLTKWVSSERDWHQDDYLNPPTVNAHYAAVWFALDDIHQDSGVFEFVPGSHRWPALRREKVQRHLSKENAARPDWPKQTEKMVVAAIEEEIRSHGGEIKQFVPMKGDLLIWHGWLLHRGTKPKLAGLARKSIITHYTARSKRKDFTFRARWHKDQGLYFPVYLSTKFHRRVLIFLSRIAHGLRARL